MAVPKCTTFSRAVTAPKSILYIATIQPLMLACTTVSAEVDEHGEEYLSTEQWQRMDGGTLPARQSPVEQLLTKLYGDLPLAERFRVLWLSGTLFCIIGGYWLLRSLKDPIVSSMMGIEVMLTANIDAFCFADLSKFS
jgi:hypothetical protein